MPQDHYSVIPGHSNSEDTEPRDSRTSLRMLTQAVWKRQGNDDPCPDGKYPTFRQLDDLITTTAWGLEAREEFFLRWQTLQPDHHATIEVGGSISELAHLLWEEIAEKEPGLKHPLAPLIAAWQSGPLEVQAVRDATGGLRGDTIAPRIAMRDGGNTRTDRLYLNPAHFSTDGEGGQMVLPGLKDGQATGRIPVLPINLYDLGVQAGEGTRRAGDRSDSGPYASEDGSRPLGLRAAR